MGGSAEFIRRFVYLYHLVIFFYCSGFCYKELKLTDFTRGLFRKYYVPFVCVEGVSIVLYPLWLFLKVIPEVPITTILTKIARAILFLPAENMAGAMWFVPFLAAAQMCFWISLHICNSCPFLRSKPYIFSLILGFIGGLLVLNHGVGKYYLFIALLMQPVMVMGYMARKCNWFNSLITLRFLVLPSAAIMLLIVKFSNRQIELSKGEIFENPFLFYLITFVGIVFCFSLSSIIAGYDPLKNLMQSIGKMSFYCMAFQFVAFKLIDVIYGVFCQCDQDTLVVFPYSFAQLRPVYLVFAVVFSMLLGHIISTCIVQQKQAKENYK